MPTRESIVSIAKKAFVECGGDRDLFDRFVWIDLGELGLLRVIKSLSLRMSQILFDHWTESGTIDPPDGLPQRFLDLYAETVM